MVNNNTVSVGVGGVVVRDGKILLVQRHRSHGDREWSTPGGYLDFGESLEICARREIEEETGVISNDFEFLAITNDLFLDHSLHFVTVWMLGRWVSGTPRVCATDEIARAEWFSVDSLPSPIFPPLEKLLSGSGCFIGDLAPLRGLFNVS